MKVLKIMGLWIILALAWSLIAPAASLAAKRIPPKTETAKQNGADYWLGKEIYEEICFSCHGSKGDGKGPSWRSSEFEAEAAGVHQPLHEAHDG